HRARQARRPGRREPRRPLPPPAHRPPQGRGLRDVVPSRQRRVGARTTGGRVGAPRDGGRARAPRARHGADQGMVDLDGGPLSLEAVEAVARRGEEVRLAPGPARALVAGRRFVEGLAASATPIYGITTGVGKLKDVVIPPAERAELQRNLVLSHAGGVGAPLSEEEVRAVVLLLAASLARGASGVRPAVVETLIACLNRRVHPVVPGP